MASAVGPTCFPVSSGTLAKSLLSFLVVSVALPPGLGSFCLVTLHPASSGFFCNRSTGHMFLDSTEVKSGMIFFLQL